MHHSLVHSIAIEQLVRTFCQDLEFDNLSTFHQKDKQNLTAQVKVTHKVTPEQCTLTRQPHQMQGENAALHLQQRT